MWRRPGWRRAQAAFVARPPRERALLIGGSVALLLVAGWLLWIEPALLQHKRLQREMAQHTTELQSLQPRLETLRALRQDPDRARKAQAELLRGQLARLDADFAQFQDTLAAPRDMGRLVGALLKQHGGLQLLAWRSLPVAPLGDLVAAQRGVASAPASAAAAASAGSAASAATAVTADSWLYLHGIEISVSGSYADMQSWLQQIERLPRHLYWGSLTVDARAWPASVMTVTLYTVSLERTWWAL